MKQGKRRECDKVYKKIYDRFSSMFPAEIKLNMHKYVFINV